MKGRASGEAIVFVAGADEMMVVGGIWQRPRGPKKSILWCTSRRR